MPSTPIPLPLAGAEQDTDLVCHCRKVTYADVRSTIRSGDAKSLSDVQRATTACTRCFGCRFELERMLKDELGDQYVRTEFVARPDDERGALRSFVSRIINRGAETTKRMYMPVLHGMRGDVRTRVVLFHHDDGTGKAPIDVRADLLRLDGTRVDVWHTSVAPGHSAVLNVADLAGAEHLIDGVGSIKLVLDADRVGSLRPYFHFISSGGITTTHEKSSPKFAKNAVKDRWYHWTFPVGAGPQPSEAYLYCLNAIPDPIRDREIAWHGQDGEQASVPFPELELDQAIMAPLHEYFPSVGEGGKAGSVRITPTTHVAGHILRYDPRSDRWRVQHL